MSNTIPHHARELTNHELEFVSGGEIKGESAFKDHSTSCDANPGRPSRYEQTLGLLMKAMGA